MASGEVELQKGYRAAGDIEIQRIVLVTPRGTSFDIGPMVIEFNVFQDLFQHHMTCELVMNDSQNLLGSLGLNEDDDDFNGFTGNEVLFISYKTKVEDLEFVNHGFVLHEIGRRIRVDEHNETYVLNGISVEALRTKTTNVSRAVGRGAGKEIHKIVEDFANEFYISNETKAFYTAYQSVFKHGVEKKYTGDKTNGRHKFIIPNTNVDEAITLLCTQADNDTHIPLFTFYEDSNGYNFRDINKLVEQEAKATYRYLPSNVPIDQVYLDSNNITSYSVIRQTSYLKNALGGLFSAKTYNIDLLKKQKKEVSYSYENTQSKFSKLQSAKILGNPTGDVAQYMFTSRTGHGDSGSIFAAENPAVKKLNTFAASKKSYHRHIFNMVLEVTVPGDSTLNVGDVVFLNIPSASNKKDAERDGDKYLSGKYIITKLRQKMRGKTGDGFVSIFECAKDTRL
jgi:hypothetical protein